MHWGMRSLDYLWQGIGAYLAAHQPVQYLFGPVSLSSSLPKSARDMVAYFYTIHFPDLDRLAVATHPYVIDPATKAHLQKKCLVKNSLQIRTGCENSWGLWD